MVTREQPDITTRYTLAQFHEYADRPENSGRLFELIDGEMVEKVGSFIPSLIASRIIKAIMNYLDANPIGYVTGEGGSYAMSEVNQFIPDVAYISKERLPELPPREAPVPPDLAVEVKSPTDRVRSLRSKAERYLELGTVLVWLVFPEEQTVEVYTADSDVQVFRVGDVLTGGALLPGFTMPVQAIFPG